MIRGRVFVYQLEIFKDDGESIRNLFQQKVSQMDIVAYGTLNLVCTQFEFPPYDQEFR